MRLVRGADILVREASISAAAESLGAMKLELGGKIGRDAIAPGSLSGCCASQNGHRAFEIVSCCREPHLQSALG